MTLNQIEILFYLYEVGGDHVYNYALLYCKNERHLRGTFNRLEENGYLESELIDRRRIFKVTEKGMKLIEYVSGMTI